MGVFTAITAVVVAPAAFLLPGWLIARRLGSPAPLLTAFLTSAALWFYLVLACDTFGIRLGPGPLFGGWAILCAGAVWWSRRVVSPFGLGTLRAFRPVGLDWLWLAVALMGLASIGARAVVDPLSGWDNGFRWDYLARAFLAKGNLHFYPPVKAADFEVYAWCDGIPPLVPLLNVWLYLVTGTTRAVVTAVRVVAEALLIGRCVYGLGCELWGRRGGWSAVGMLGASALLLWGVTMGQEAGLLTLALVAMVWLLERHRRDSQTGTVAWAAVAAGVGALSREYGLAIPLLGFLVLAIRRVRKQDLAVFALVATLIGAPWYLRNWIHTGNPIYPLAPAGIFPTNPVYTEMMKCVANVRAFTSHGVNVGVLMMTLAVVTGVLAAAGVVGIWRAKRTAAVPLAAILTITGLWLWSVPFTAGGLNYSLRVLTPAVALLAALAGWVGTLPSQTWRALGLAAAALFAADAARRSWFLPIYPRVPAWPWTFEPWRLVRNDIRKIKTDPLWNRLIEKAHGGLIAVDSPAAHAELAERGARTAMLFSPIFAPCFDDRTSFNDKLNALRDSGVRLFVLSVGDRIVRPMYDAHPFFRRLIHDHRPSIEFYGATVFDLTQISPRTPEAPPRRPR